MKSGPEDQTAQAVAELFPDDFKGVYVDVGAGFPEYYSNSALFRRMGWEVIAIEPQPKMCDEFRAKGYPILQYACASEDRGLVDFEILDNTRGLAGSAFKVLDDHPRSAIRTIKVMAFKLDTILGWTYPKLARIDVLGIDVEYYELEVLGGFDMERWKPTVLVIENLPATPPWRNQRRGELHAYYETHGYQIVAQMGWNEILVRKT